MKELIENSEESLMSKATKVTAARIEKAQDEKSPRDLVIEKVQEQLWGVYEPILYDGGSIWKEVLKLNPEKNWNYVEYDEVKSIVKNANKYKSIALSEDFYQIKYELVRIHSNYVEKDLNIQQILDALTTAMGRKPDGSSKKPYQNSSVAYRNLWYYKDSNAAIVTRVNFRDRDNTGIVYKGHSLLEISVFMYYSVLESDLKDFFGTIPLSNQVIEQAFNVGGNTDFTLNIPIQTISLNTKKIPKKFREYNQLFKLPNASIISLKFTDLRSKIEDFVEKATGIRECPNYLPKWFAPPEGTLYTSDGKTPDYISGEFPDARGKLRDSDIYKYTFRVCTKKEAENRLDGISAFEVPIPDEEGKTAFLIREEPRQTIWEKFTNKIFWTDFENSFAFYYNNEGALQKVNIQGYQDISNNDIIRLFNSGLTDTQIDLGVAIREGGREQKWFDNNPEDAHKFQAMCIDLLNHVNQYTSLTGEDLLELEQEARQRSRVSSAIITNYIEKHPEFKDLFVKFFSQVGATDALIKARDAVGNRDAVALAKLMELGVDYHKSIEEVKKLEEEHLEIARDPKANTPFLPKDIKNFNSNVSLFAQQAIAVSMANNQKTAILDVDMGGGKTCMMVADILNQMSKGLVKKPLIVCPNKTLVQNKREIYEKWTDRRMNVFILNTETYREITNGGKNLDKLVEIMNKMPANTIFMTSYNFLTRDNYEVPTEELRNKQGELEGYDYTTIYPIPKLLLQDVGIDMVYCDESQYIKNKRSGCSNAVAALSGASIKRITSGTIIPNNPIDLFAQLRFVDPSILGTEDSFIKRYAEFGDGRGKIVKWKEGAQKQIREQIERKGGVSIRRSMWRWMMPKLDEQVHFVNLTAPQAQLYEYLMTLAIEEIKKDPKLSAAYEKLKEEDGDTGVEDEEEGVNQMKVLSILSKVTGYLAAPATHQLIDEFKNFDPKVLESMSFTEEDFVGPKIYKMRDILSKHFAGQKDWKQVGKVIVFTERVAVAQHAFEYLGDMKTHAVWYKAGMDSELEKFKNDDEIWILIAVDKSIKEGQNLQIASRIIRLDIPWTPGDLNQSYARAFRTGQQKDVAIDIVLCDGSMEICKYNNLISKEYIARKIISSFDEGDDRDFIPVKMNINNMQTIKWKERCEPYIEMHKRINEQELEESKVFGEKYKNYFASGVSKVGSRDDLAGSKMVYVPEPREERILVDENGKVIKTDSGRVKRSRVKYDIDDIGVELDLLKGKYDEKVAEEDDSVDDTQDVQDTEDKVEIKEEDKRDTGLHLYFLEQDETLYLIAFQNKSTNFLKRLKFAQDPVMYVKPINTVEEVKQLGKKLAKQGYENNLAEISDLQSFKRLMAKPKKAGALQRVKKHFVVTSGKEVEFFFSRMEGQMFICTYEKIEGFNKIAKFLWYEVPNKARAEYILKKIAKEADITNTDELALDFKSRFKTAIDFEKLGIGTKKETKTEKKPEVKKVEEKKPASAKYNGKQIVLGLLNHAKAEKDIANAYKIWLKAGGLDFKKLLEKKGVTNVTQSVKYLTTKSDKFAQKIIDWFNSNRKSVVVRFMNEYKKDAGAFSKMESFCKEISK